MGRKKRTAAEGHRLPFAGDDCDSAETPVVVWADQQGLHTVTVGLPPTEELREEFNRRFQENLRRSPLWQELLRHYGATEAEQIIHKCRARLA